MRRKHQLIMDGRNQRKALEISRKAKLRQNWNYPWVLYPLLIMVFLFFIDQLLPGLDIKSYGIKTRQTSGLLGIFFSPFLHANLRHLLGNILPLLIMLNILVLFYKKSYWLVLLFCICIGGSLTWLLGSDGLHIGASGLVFSLASFFAVSGFIRKKIMLIIIGVVVAYSYKSLLGGLLGLGINYSNVSYSSHWGGLIAGVLIAFISPKLEIHSKKSRGLGDGEAPKEDSF